MLNGTYILAPETRKIFDALHYNFGIRTFEDIVTALDNKEFHGRKLDQIDINFIKKIIKDGEFEINFGVVVDIIRKQLKTADQLADCKRMLKRSRTILYKHEKEIMKLEHRLGWYDFSLKKPAVSKYRPINLIFHNRRYEMDIGYYNGVNFARRKGTTYDSILGEDVKYWKYVQIGRRFVIPADSH